MAGRDEKVRQIIEAIQNNSKSSEGVTDTIARILQVKERRLWSTRDA